MFYYIYTIPSFIPFAFWNRSLPALQVVLRYVALQIRCWSNRRGKSLHVEIPAKWLQATVHHHLEVIHGFKNKAPVSWNRHMSTLCTVLRNIRKLSCSLSFAWTNFVEPKLGGQSKTRHCLNGYMKHYLIPARSDNNTDPKSFEMM